MMITADDPGEIVSHRGLANWPIRTLLLVNFTSGTTANGKLQAQDDLAEDQQLGRSRSSP